MNAFLAARRRKLMALKELRQGAPGEGGQSAKTACPSCGHDVMSDDLELNMGVCPYCGHHFPISAARRIELVVDEGSWKEAFRGMTSGDPLKFPGYAEKLSNLRGKTGLNDALVCGTARIGGRKVAIAALDTRFLMGSMGAVVGEKLTRLVERAAKSHLPLIVFSASGGARMQEGIVSLMQMAKTSAAIEHFSRQGGLFISIFTHPTTGGVTASFASLGDVTLAEPGALVGFAGPRVIEQTIGEKLPEGFQTSEYLLEHGFVDEVVPRGRMRSTLVKLLTLYGKVGTSHAER